MRVGENSEVIKYQMGSLESRIEIQRVTSEKDFGVIIDEKLKFREHIVQNVNTANKNLGIIFRTFTYMDKEMFLTFRNQWSAPHCNMQHKFDHHNTNRIKSYWKMYRDEQRVW